MSMELHVFSDCQLDTIAEWQRAIEIEKYPLRLTADVQLAAVQGLLPAMLDDKQSGFECYRDDAAKTMEFLGNEHFHRRWAFALGFRWGGDFSQLDAAWMAATAYAGATDGIIFDHEEGRVFSAQQGRELVAKFVRERPQMLAHMDEILRKIAEGRF
jgi:hypothetical protein